MTEKDDLVFIGHILDNIEKIEKFSKNLDMGELEKNELRQYAIVRAIEIIGEASKNISQNLKDKYKEVQWKEIAGMRDKVIHYYFGVNLDVVWGVINNHLPVLKEQMLKIKLDLIEIKKKDEKTKNRK